MLTTVVAALVVAVALLAAPAAARAEVPSRTLFLTESLRPTSVRGPIAGPVQPHDMVAQAGEEEGFILAVRPTADTQLEAFVAQGSDTTLQAWTQFLRVEWVTTTRPSTGVATTAGRYADPLPPQLGELGAFGPGKLTAPANQWSGFVVVVSVPAGLAAGTYRGTIGVRDTTGTVIASSPYSITVVDTKTASGTSDPAITPRDKRNFKVLFNFNPNWYRGVAPATTLQAQYEQTYRTLWMLARHRAAPTNWQRAYPSGDGTYECSAAGGYLKAYDAMPWWADGQPGALPVKVMPNNTVARCTQDGFEIRDQRSKATKYDDRIGDVSKSAWFIYNVADRWRKEGVQDDRTYFLNPFDEPDGPQNATQVPQVNTLVHTYAPGVKVLGTTWPMAKGGQTVCRGAGAKRRCAKRPGQPNPNVNLRDGGKDDLDGWIAPYFRAWGFGQTAQQKAAGIERSHEVISRLKAIQKAGGEAWTYDLPLGSTHVPRLDIDAPSTDARFEFWPLGREGFQGWFIAVSNRWVDPNETTKPRNPWDEPLSWVGSKSADVDNMGPHGVVSNGWGSLYYPGYRPQLGLTDPLAQPVSSLRLERMRDGVEDANLMYQYRARFGQAALTQRLRGVLGAPRSHKDLPTGESFPAYRNQGLALRMEVVRRQMLAELAG